MICQGYYLKFFIDLVHEAQLVSITPYHMAPRGLIDLRKKLDQLLAKGFIQRSTLPQGAIVLFAKKAKGSLRLCVDYWKLSPMTIKNKNPFPRIDGLCDLFRDSKFFSMIDFKSDYHQLKIYRVPKIAFRMIYSHFEFLVMQFRLPNGPAIFMDLMN